MHSEVGRKAGMGEQATDVQVRERRIGCRDAWIGVPMVRDDPLLVLVEEFVAVPQRGDSPRSALDVFRHMDESVLMTEREEERRSAPKRSGILSQMTALDAKKCHHEGAIPRLVGATAKDLPRDTGDGSLHRAEETLDGFGGRTTGQGESAGRGA